MGRTARDTARQLWERRGVRRFALFTGLVLQMALIGFTLGWTLTSTSNPRAVAHHARATAPTEIAETVADRDRE